MNHPPTHVYITIDTEISAPLTEHWRTTALADEIDRDVYGRTDSGEFGIRFLMQALNAYGLKGVFFVESLFACETGLAPLRAIVECIGSQGQEVQLHLHTEWLERMSVPIVAATGQHMRCFSRQDQAKLIRRGVQNLQECGVQKITAFRAGNYGGNWDTLRALSENGVPIDSTYNLVRMGKACEMPADKPIRHPMRMEGVTEFPVTVFYDWPGHLRPLQVCACSSEEMQAVLMSAWRQEWKAVVIVCHSFELIKRLPKPKPLRIVANRFERLCRFLGEHRNKFRVEGFLDCPTAPSGVQSEGEMLKSPILYTGLRFLEQAVTRVV